MNFLCPACRTPLPRTPEQSVVPCAHCGVQVDLTRLDTAPGTARLWPDVDLTGEQLGPYRLEKRIAAGGMGIVYEALGPSGSCAVKVLSALLAAEPELRKRFRREAAALRAVEHEAVVRVFDEGEDPRGFCWYAMERIHGPDLRARIEKGALPAAEVEALGRRMLSALAAVHAKGLVHRDVKPGNILLAADGPKLCDFGIARFDGSSTLTESAAVLGSLRYMSPEQRLGKAGAKSDLYSLGIVLYEALSGGVPGEVPLARKVPSRLRRLVEALLAERVAERPADANAALALLDARPRSGLVAVAAAATLVLAGGGFASWRLASPDVALLDKDAAAGSGENQPVTKDPPPMLPNALAPNAANDQASPTVSPVPQEATVPLEPQTPDPSVPRNLKALQGAQSDGKANQGDEAAQPKPEDRAGPVQADTTLALDTLETKAVKVPTKDLLVPPTAKGKKPLPTPVADPKEPALTKMPTEEGGVISLAPGAEQVIHVPGYVSANVEGDDCVGFKELGKDRLLVFAKGEGTAKLLVWTNLKRRTLKLFRITVATVSVGSGEQKALDEKRNDEEANDPLLEKRPLPKTKKSKSSKSVFPKKEASEAPSGKPETSLGAG